MQEWAIGIGIMVAVSAFARFVPKAKLIGWLAPKFYNAGKFVSKFLLIRLGRKSAERIEEGVIITICMTLSECIGKFVDGLLNDNEARKGENKK